MENYFAAELDANLQALDNAIKEALAEPEEVDAEFPGDVQ